MLLKDRRPIASAAVWRSADLAKEGEWVATPGTPVSQDARGNFLGHVRDLGRASVADTLRGGIPKRSERADASPDR